MPNNKGWYNKQEVLDTGLPYWINANRGWTQQPYPFAVLLTKSRCKEFGVPILSSGNEKPSAFRYAAAAGTGTGDNKHRYYPLYDRTDVYEVGEITKEQLFRHEVMGDFPEEEGA
ncbi:hypothetical protein WMW72_10750 [Paenibacillus filicis]|uniref:Uncharacterized protein n=1 Tax=Paenibacillus filicis TaxID=669464 RepID=A0ABU9DJM1_9BACL